MSSFQTTPAEEPGHFYLNNHLFDGMDALVAYCMVRHFQPHLLIEVGCPAFLPGFWAKLPRKTTTRLSSASNPFLKNFSSTVFAGCIR